MIYLPIAHLSISVIWLLLIAFIAGFYGGFFSIGGGIIFTPVLILLGVPIYVAVGTTSAYIFGTSFGGFYKILNSEEGLIDYKLGNCISFGSFFGGIIGAVLIKLLRNTGKLDIVVIVIYIFCCITIISLVMYDIISFLRKKNIKFSILEVRDRHLEKINERAVNTDKVEQFMSICSGVSGRNFSLIMLVSIGFITSVLATTIGLGGGIFMVPVFLYLLKLNYKIAMNTSVYCTMLSMLSSTIVHSYINHSIDLVLLAISLPISIIGTRIGISLSRKIDQYIVKSLFVIALSSTVILFVGKITHKPDNIFSIDVIK